MSQAKLVLDFRDAQYRSTRRTLADGLMRLEKELGARPDAQRCHLHVPRGAIEPASFATLWYRSNTGADIIVAFPSSRGCWARGASVRDIYLPLDQLDGALLDQYENILLTDGRSVRALEFETLPHPKDFTEIEHAIVWLTVRFLNAEDIGLRYMPEPGYWWIDYSRLPKLRVQNVKTLDRYINAHIDRVPWRVGKSALDSVSLDKIQKTLVMAGIQKVRGRKPKSRRLANDIATFTT